MRLQTMMVIKAAACLAVGLPILVAPVWLYSLFGVSLGAESTLPARQYGAALMGNLMVTWFARNAAESDARRAIVLGLCVYDAVGFVVALVAQLTGLPGPLGWLAVALYLFFAVGFGYFLLPRR